MAETRSVTQNGRADKGSANFFLFLEDSHLWQFVAERCRLDLPLILASIMDAKQFSLARQVCTRSYSFEFSLNFPFQTLRLFASQAQPPVSVSDLEEQIEALEILHLLEQGGTSTTYYLMKGSTIDKLFI